MRRQPHLRHYSPPMNTRIVSSQRSLSQARFFDNTQFVYAIWVDLRQRYDKLLCIKGNIEAQTLQLHILVIIHRAQLYREIRNYRRLNS